MDIYRCITFTRALTKAILTVSSKTIVEVWQGFLIMATDCKNTRLIKKIGTHNGVFHCDEALACFMLKQLPEYCEADIIRTRDSNVLATCDIVVDVGGVYDPKIHRYDHHQRSFIHTLNSVRPDLTNNKFKTIKLSSAGLVYAHFGLNVISEIFKKRSIVVNSNSLLSLYDYIYEGFVEEIDGIDNGVPICTEGKPQYKINTHLSARIGRLNPAWNSPEIVSMDDLFQIAMKTVGDEFVNMVVSAAKQWWPARKIVQEAIDNRKKVHESGEVIILEKSCPWKEHLVSLEKEMGLVGELKFCIFQEKTDSWRVQAIPITPDSFILRIPLHKDWRGVREEELSKISNIEDCVFCHVTGFIGGNKTQKGALQMALQSIKANGES